MVAGRHRTKKHVRQDTPQGYGSRQQGTPLLTPATSSMADPLYKYCPAEPIDVHRRPVVYPDSIVTGRSSLQKPDLMPRKVALGGRWPHLQAAKTAPSRELYGPGRFLAPVRLSSKCPDPGALEVTRKYPEGPAH